MTDFEHDIRQAELGAVAAKWRFVLNPVIVLLEMLHGRRMTALEKPRREPDR